MPSWLADPIAASLDAPRARIRIRCEATAAVAARHRRPVDEVLLTAGAAAGVRAARPGAAGRDARRSWCIRSSPSRRRRCGPPATRSTGCCSRRGRLPARRRLVPADADLVFVGNPTNPTSVLHPAARSPRWPGRAGCWWSTRRSRTPRSVTASRRARVARPSGGTSRPGRAAQPHQDLGPGRPADRLPARPRRDLLRRLAAAQPLWAVSTPALAAATGLRRRPPRSRPSARSPARLAADRDHLVARDCAHVPGVTVAGDPGAARSC